MSEPDRGSTTGSEPDLHLWGLSPGYRGNIDASRRSIVLAPVEPWMPAQVERVYTLQDTPSTHRATDGLQFSLAHTRWESVFQLTSAASVNLSEAWWKTVRSPAHAGRRFGNWEEIGEAIAKATASWNAHC